MKLKEMMTLHYGTAIKNKSMKGDIPYLTLSFLEKGKNDGRVPMYESDTNINDIIVVKDGYRSGMVLKGKDGKLGSTMLALRLNSDFSNVISTEFLYYYLSFATNNLNLFQQGSTIRHLRKEKFLKIEIPVIELSKQKNICNYLNPIYDKKEKISQSIYKIERLLFFINNKKKRKIINNNKAILSNLTDIWNNQLEKALSDL